MKKIIKNAISKILIFESKLVLEKYKPTVIAITGSVGKTSTKDAIYTALSSIYSVRKSEKSFNSELGVPLTILGCPNGWSDPFVWMSNILEGLELIFFKSSYPKYLVLEVGADHPGDIQSISKWLKTDIVVMNMISDVPVHVEFFKSPEEVVKEKSYLIKTLKDSGTLVLYADDAKVANLSKDVKQNIVTFGVTEMATVTGTNVGAYYNDSKIPEGVSFRLNYKGNSIPMKIKGVLGVQQVYPIIAGALVGLQLNVPISKIVDSFDAYSFPRGRMNILEGINGSTIIDDSYNSSPDALKEGLNSLASLQVSGKRIAAIGDMMELGNFSGEEHRKAGVQALQSCDVLVTVGPRAKQMCMASTQTVECANFDSSNEAAKYLEGIVKEGDVVFIKGSQSMRMERISKVLLKDKENASKLLVRQDKEWLAKK